MIALIDIGNTRLKWGLADERGWHCQGTAASDDPASWAGAFANWPETVTAVWAASVAGGDTETALSKALGPAAGHLFWLRSGAVEQCGVRNHYTQAAQLGADRWAALIGAWAAVSCSALVVVTGTATTIDVLRADAGKGIFDGGVILPGLALMRASLAVGTAQLPEANGHFHPLPKTTNDAISTGCLEAQAGAIERMRRRLNSRAPVILSGGAAPALAPLIAEPLIRIDELVLEGLRVVALY